MGEGLNSAALCLTAFPSFLHVLFRIRAWLAYMTRIDYWHSHVTTLIYQRCNLINTLPVLIVKFQNLKQASYFHVFV